MSTPSKKTPAPPALPGFWARQFGSDVTSTQRVWDWAFGVILPTICFVMDPFVFKAGLVGEDGMLEEFRPFAYVLAAATILAITAWMLFGERLGWGAGFIAGFLISGAFVSTAVGVILFPFSLVGMVVFIGFLGFTPLVSAIILARNGVRAARLSRPYFVREARVFSVVFGAALAIAIPVAVNRDVSRMFDRINVGDAGVVRGERLRLRMYSVLYDPNRLGDARGRTDDAGKKEALDEVFRELFGGDLSAIRRRSED